MTLLRVTSRGLQRQLPRRARRPGTSTMAFTVASRWDDPSIPFFIIRRGTESLQTLRRRRQSGANSSLKRRPGDRAVNPGVGDRRRKGLTGIFGRYKKDDLVPFPGILAVSAAYAPELVLFKSLEIRAKFPLRAARIINDLNGLCGNFRRIERGYLFRPNGELEGSHQGIIRPRSGDPAFLSKPSDLAPEVIGFGLIPAGDPNGPLIRTQDDLDQRPRLERCIEALPPPADAVRGDRGAQAPYRRWQRRDYGARSAEEDVGGRPGQLIRGG